MFRNNSDGLVLLIASTAIIIGTLIWNTVIPKKYKLTFDNAEKLFIYLLVLTSVLIVIYLSFKG